MRVSVIGELTRRAEDGWVTVSAVDTALLNWLDKNQHPTDGEYIIGWRAIGAVLGLAPGTCQVYSSRGQFGNLPPKLIRGHPAYTLVELERLRLSLSNRKFNRKVSVP